MDHTVTDTDVNGQPKWQCQGCLGWWPMEVARCPFLLSDWHPDRQEDSGGQEP